MFAENGESALENARRIAPDIVITEILVSGLDGLTLCRQLKADPQTKGIAVLVFSILSAAGRARQAPTRSCASLSPTAYALMIVPVPPVRIGAAAFVNDNNGHFDGVIDEVRYYNYALSDSAVANLTTL